MEQKGLVVGAELAPFVLAPSVEKVPPSVGQNQLTSSSFSLWCDGTREEEDSKAGGSANVT